MISNTQRNLFNSHMKKYYWTVQVPIDVRVGFALKHAGDFVKRHLFPDVRRQVTRQVVNDRLTSETYALRDLVTTVATTYVEARKKAATMKTSDLSARLKEWEYLRVSKMFCCDAYQIRDNGGSYTIKHRFEYKSLLGGRSVKEPWRIKFKRVAGLRKAEVSLDKGYTFDYEISAPLDYLKQMDHLVETLGSVVYNDGFFTSAFEMQMYGDLEEIEVIQLELTRFVSGFGRGNGKKVVERMYLARHIRHRHIWHIDYDHQVACETVISRVIQFVEDNL